MKHSLGWRSPLLAVGALTLLAGCAMEQAPQSPAYRAGYSDGCQTGRSEVGSPLQRAQDAARMGEADYARGWRDGHDVCYLDAERQQRRERDRP